jgi:outer membrane protein OmpA-like peptidoglycan-associated protein
VRLDREPGIVVIGTERHWSSYSVRGLRDPLAPDPVLLLAGFGLPVQKVSESWEPYLSLDPHFAGMRQLEADKATLKQQVIRFDLNSAQLRVDQMALVETIEAQINQLRHAAEANGQQIQIEIDGHTDSSGEEGHNIELSRTRSETVMRALEERGVPRSMLISAGVGATRPEHAAIETYPQELDRRVTFQVTLIPQPPVSERPAP